MQCMNMASGEENQARIINAPFLSGYKLLSQDIRILQAVHYLLPNGAAGYDVGNKE
jgi:hypothetical protein